VRETPISEAAFLGAAVGAAMSGLRPVVEIMLVDFIGVAFDALLNQAAKIEAFSGGRWHVPLVVRAACGGGYGDAGQHEQSLWGLLAHIPGLAVVAPACPGDAGSLMLGAIDHPEPVIYLEHKLLADYWLDAMGGASRKTVSFDAPAQGARGPVPRVQKPVAPGVARLWREGGDITLVSLAVGVHRALEAAATLAGDGIDAEVIDLRSVAPLDVEALCASVAKTGRLLVIDEDYRDCGLSGELAALVLERGLRPAYGRVCTECTIPCARSLEEQVLPSAERIVESARRLNGP
jgi:pyruvate dehydrogenase E1 component beta subunit